MTSFCLRCDGFIDPEAIRRELTTRTRDIPETVERAAAASVFCGLSCALEDWGDGSPRRGERSGWQPPIAG